MGRQWITLPLIFITIALHADTRKEPSLLLEYERELKKSNDQNKENDNPFTRNGPLVMVPRPTLPAAPIVGQITPKEPRKVQSDPNAIGQDVSPFLVVNKPAPVAAAAACPEEKNSAISDKSPTLVSNLLSAKNRLISRAREFLGTPYGFGNKSGDRTDCSGFTQQVFSQFGISLPHSAAEQAQLGTPVDLKDLQVGDLLFYRTYKSDPSHVAIYAGDGQMIHASYNARRVQFDSIEKGYYKDRFLYAKRVALNDVGGE
ncbi:MAG: C40 family peptidase [Sulfuricurvum sp.]